MRVDAIARVVLPVALVGGALSAAADDGVAVLDSDLRQLHVSLDGAPHYYALTPEMGRVVLRRPATPSEDETDDDVLVVMDGDGRQIFKRTPGHDLPEEWDGRVIDATLRAPDRLVMTGYAERASFILAEYDLGTGELVRSVRTESIHCWDLQGDAESTIWCMGRDSARIRDDRDYDLVYRFDASGSLVSSSLPRSAFPESVNPTGLKRCCGHGRFLSGEGEVRLWLPAVGELVSFDMDGEVRERVTLPEVEDLLEATLVTTAGDEVYALLSVGPDSKDLSTREQTLVRLAPDGAAWIPVEGAPQNLPPSSRLVGADSGGLILFDRRTMTLIWYPLSTEEADADS
jgi:hypothetical protein